LICAGASGTQWLANKYPDRDKNSIRKLTDCLYRTKIKKLVLISTIAVYPNPINVDEDTEINSKELNSYGYNRLKLEQDLQSIFDTTILRLPALYGQGLKKNVLFDLLNKQHTEKINPMSSYQFYNLEKISDDIDNALNLNLKLLNLSTAPLYIHELIDHCFDFKINFNKDNPQRREDMLSKFYNAFNKNSGYLYSKEEVLEDLKIFIKNYKLSRE
tara:strand:- start:11786 stop:12433 length:648 start_codon:yes stop_codon:yes gene_type:complete